MPLTVKATGPVLKGRLDPTANVAHEGEVRRAPSALTVLTKGCVDTLDEGLESARKSDVGVVEVHLRPFVPTNRLPPRHWPLALLAR